MKRVAVIAIFLAMMASLFAFPVFADTPVQPLQVITYSDTTTNVRISGTAERLHYNVDSFQVVFMNPPNNYGTACTPVLVSFRFYNASDIPAYVGQPEFEITATTGTGAVNTIIYGYDQISTDLFVAESSYNTAEVGRIGIGASNDFAYYTGFVIPPRTSLYFSCIVYVNASAYAQNNTGATEDVNQVTLSALNLYSNQISFSADYPYHNQPIDFSSIITAIEDLSDLVSTSSEMQMLIDYVKYDGQVATVDPFNSYSFSQSNTLTDTNGYIEATLRRFVNRPVITNDELVYEPTSDTNYHSYSYYVDSYYSIVLNNKSGYPLRFAGVGTFRIVPPYIGYESESFSDFSSDIFTDYYFNSTPLGSNIHLISRYIQESSSTVVITPGYHVVNFKIRSIFNNVSTYNIPTLTDTWLGTNLNQARIYNEPIGYNDSTNINEIRNTLNKFYEAYANVNGLDDIDSTADDIKDKSESAHTQEQSYFTQNAQAIQATGLSNYRFSGDQENGIGSVSHDFTLLWNALGGFNSIYIFSLTLSLALMILRHAPGAIRSSSRNKKE